MDNKAISVLEFDKIKNKLISFTTSILGKEISKSLVPNTDYKIVEQILRETTEAVNVILKRGDPPLYGIRDIRESLKRVQVGAILHASELLRIAETLSACYNLKRYINDNMIASQESDFTNLINSLITHKKIEDKIKLAIISEEEISDDASSNLRSIRKQISDIHNSIRGRLNRIIRSSKYQKMIQDAIITMRGDRYVIPVRQEYRREISGLIHDSSASGATIFIEPMEIVEANNEIKQLKIKEQIEIEKILEELTYEVSLILNDLICNISVLANVDFIFAKAKLSLEYNCVCPKINNKKLIIIKKARHPLLINNHVVPIDILIGDNYHTLVITGPNTGGKTVALKTVGLFCLMTQAGLHIPASDGTEMFVFDKIFADIGDEQNIEQSLSTFSSHMGNIVNIISKVNYKSLVLLDELGAGTDPTEGAALAMSILEHLHKKGAITVATTHYSELKLYAISTDSVENACCEFDVETLKPTYKLLIGVPGKSNAFAISSKLGLGESIISRATEFLSSEDIKFEDILQSIEHNLSQSQKDKILAETYKLEAEKLKDELERENKKLKKEKDNILREAKQEALRILADAKNQINEAQLKIKEIEAQKNIMQNKKELNKIKTNLHDNINNIEKSMIQPLFPKGLSKGDIGKLNLGDTVYISSLNQTGTVLSLPDKNNEVNVQVGIMKVNIPKSNLRLIDNKKQDTINSSGAGKIGKNKSLSVSTEIHVRGLTLDEALDIVDKYLDDAVLAGLSQVTIVHGKGTGVLRSGIQRYLRGNSRVKSYRLGMYGEGESGVTIVELK